MKAYEATNKEKLMNKNLIEEAEDSAMRSSNFNIWLNRYVAKMGILSNSLNILELKNADIYKNDFVDRYFYIHQRSLNVEFLRRLRLPVYVIEKPLVWNLR